jgi:hypothetical protein
MEAPAAARGMCHRSAVRNDIFSLGSIVFRALEQNNVRALKDKKSPRLFWPIVGD